MTVRERLHSLIEEISESDLLTLERMVRGLALPRDGQRSPLPEDERRRRAYALAGRYAHLHTSVDEFLARKREEVALEEERYP